MTTTEAQLDQWAASARRAVEQPDDATFVVVADVGQRLHNLGDSVLRSEAGIGCLMDVSKALQGLGHNREALGLAARATALCRESGSPALMRRCLNYIAAICGEADASGAAVQAYAESLALAVELGDQNAEAAVWNNLGATLLRRRLWSLSGPMLERALALSGERLPSVARKAKINMALVALHARRLDDGLAGIDSVMRGGDEVKTIDDAVRSAAAAGIRGRLLSARGAFEEAATVIAQARERTTACNSQTALHALDVAEGVLYVQRGALDRGLSLLHEAVARGHLLQDSLVTDAKLAMIESLMDVGQRVLAQQELRDLAQQMGKRYVERTADVVSLAEAAMRRSGHGEIDLAVAQAVDAELIEEPSGEHAFRVAGLCGELAAAMCRDEAAVCAFKRVGLLHDVGKGGIPAPLMAAGEIELDELNLIRRHAAIGADFLRRLGLKDGSPVLRGVIEAHERVDSRGYPHGLPGEDISDEALAVAVAEAFDVMVHGRRWSAPKTTQEAVQELRRCTGAQFAASWVEALNRVLLVMPADIESRDKALLQSGGADRDPMLRAWSYLRMRLVESAPPASGRNAT